MASHTNFSVTIDLKTRKTFLTIDATYTQELWTFITSATQRSLSSVQRTNRSVQLCCPLAASCHHHRGCWLVSGPPGGENNSEEEGEDNVEEEKDLLT